MPTIKILQGDNIELLKNYPDNYFDSIVTDCPYGLGKEPNANKLLQDWIDHGYHEVKGVGFMGKSWDAFVPQPIFWKEIFRVLKPGGYVLAFFGTRTYDWGTLAIRLAGFEIRDMITWHYGSGFPKSLDISKSIDSQKGEIRELTRSGIDKKIGKNIKFDVRASNKRERYDNAVCEEAKEAKEAKGWGTALKPATEPICVARKPLIGNVAENFLKFGTGGINLDGCRIEFESDEDLASATYGTGTNILGGNYVGSKLTDGRKNIEANSLGRFPANVIFDTCMADILDKQTGILKSGSTKSTYITKESTNNSMSGKNYERAMVDRDGDSGGASRFFYCAKASQDERSLGCDGIEAQKTNDGRGVEADNAFQRGKNERNNFHPTVKPISLMRYLQRLVTPKGGITLDPFAGSGTSGCSASFEDIGEIVLMEGEETYIPIIEARTKYWSIEKNRNNYIENIKDKPVEEIKTQLKMFA